VKAITAIECSEEWAKTVSGQLKDRGFSNAQVHLVGDDDNYLSEVNSICSEIDATVILVDGIKRAQTALWALDKANPGGLLILDDSHRYLPSQSRAPGAIKSVQDPGFQNSQWPEFHQRTAHMRKIRVSSGVSDTTIFLVS